MRKWISSVALALLAAVMVPRGLAMLSADGRIYRHVADVPPHTIAIVFGAGVRNGQPTAMLYDRVASAVALYEAGAVRRLLMSGDNRFEDYNEPAVMRRVARQLGVPEEAIVLDFAGRSTYDTCYRARAIFGVRLAVLVTQDFHLDRAIMTCNALGIEVVGYVADRRRYRRVWWNELRELPATTKALLDVFILRPRPVLGEPIPLELE